MNTAPELDHHFFKLSPEELSYMVEKRDITLKGRIKNPSQLGSYLHRDIQSGDYDLSNESLLLQEYQLSHTVNWSNFDIQKIYRQYAQTYYDKNEIYIQKRKTFFNAVINNSKDKTLLMLVIAAVISLAIGFFKMVQEGDKFAWIEGTSIMLAIIVIILIGAVNEHSQEKLYNKLDKKRHNYIIKIYKNYVLDTVNLTDLVVGDIIYLEPGDIVPADAVMLTDDLAICDESQISGESVPVDKGLIYDPFLISGTYLIDGIAKAMVISVGKNSVKGKIMQNINAENIKTPLEIKVELLASKLAQKAFYVALVLFSCHLFKLFLVHEYGINKIMSLLVESISIVVMAVPEGLPMAITLALSMGTKRMLRDNNLVRDVSACEAMNNTNYICTDKTGTLTYNEMCIKYIYAGFKLIHVKKAFDDDKTNLLEIMNDKTNFDLALKNMILNSSAFKNHEGVYIGSKSESAILKILDKKNVKCSEMRRKYQVVKRTPFSSTHKYMATIINYKNKFYVFFKGAPEKIARFCTKQTVKKKNEGSDNNNMIEMIYGETSSNKQGNNLGLQNYENEQIRIKSANASIFDTEIKTQIDFERFEKMTNPNITYKKFKKKHLNRFIEKCDMKCYRTMAFAFAELENYDPEAVILGKYPLTFNFAIAMQDPVRKNISNKIKQCQEAGIHLIMLTGDKLALAKTLAKKLGILKKPNMSITGNQLKSKSDAELSDIIYKISVVARASPEDKKRFVTMLQDKGNIVAVTGDGSNDGPALKTANVGFGMGMSGTELAKEASNVILLDDNFTSLIKCVEWGRCINSSVRKFIQFQLTTTVTTVVVAIISSLFSKSGQSAFSPLKLLWINIIMDTFAALALSSDIPTKDLLRRGPEPKNMPILTETMKWFIILASSYHFIVVACLYFYHFSTTFIFNTFIYLLLFNEVNARSLGPFFSPFAGLLNNYVFMITNLVVMVSQYAFVNHFGVVFKTIPMSFRDWIHSLIIGFTIIPFFVFVRIGQRMKLASNRSISRILRDLGNEIDLIRYFFND